MHAVMPRTYLHHGPKPSKFIGPGYIHGPKPYDFIGFGDSHGLDTGQKPKEVRGACGPVFFNLCTVRCFSFVPPRVSYDFMAGVKAMAVTKPYIFIGFGAMDFT